MVSLEVADSPPLCTRSLKTDRNISETGTEHEIREQVVAQRSANMRLRAYPMVLSRWSSHAKSAATVCSASVAVCSLELGLSRIRLVEWPFLNGKDLIALPIVRSSPASSKLSLYLL